MNQDSGVALESLKVDGGMVGNDLLMQFQADLLGVPVIRPKVPETTSLGAAYAAGLATGLLGRGRGPARELGRGQALGAQMDSAKRDEYYKYWKRPSRGPSTGSTPRRRCSRGSVAAARRAARSAGASMAACRLQADVLVIGGGATGAGVAWDAALRGFDVVLVERGDLAEGTSGRFHGLLHSGGRYVVKDPRRRRGVRRRERDPARGHPGLHRGHGRPVRHHARRRPGLRRPVPGGLPRRRAAGRGDRVAEALRREPRLNPGSGARSPSRTRRSTRGRPSGRSPAAPPRTARGSSPTTA